MASKAAHGYKAFCRQDFVGIDYGLIDCATYSPLPDYYAGILWGRLMGMEVITLHNNRSDHQLRTYAHCSAISGARDELEPRGLTVLLINLDSRAQPSITLALTTLRFPNDSIAPVQAKMWTLSGIEGTNSSRVALNGVELKLAGQGSKLPPMDGKTIEVKQSRINGSMQLLLPPLAPATIAFVELADIGDVVGCPSLSAPLYHD